MTNLIKSTALLIALLLLVSLASCDVINDKISEITAPLDEQISQLEGQLSALNSEIADLNRQIEELEAAKGALEEASDELTESKSALEDEKEELESEKAALEEEKTALESEKAALEKEKAALESEKTALDGDKAALESDKEKLEGENTSLEKENKELAEGNAELEATIEGMQSTLRCARGEHIWDGESEIKHSWHINMTSCYTYYTCSECERAFYVTTTDITVDENGVYTATFEGGFPDAVYAKPMFTGVSFNSDSQAYNKATNTFRLSSGNPLVVTFNGKNLNNIDPDDQYAVAVRTTKSVYRLDYICDSQYDLISRTDTAVTLTFDPDLFGWDSESYGYIAGFSIYNLKVGVQIDDTGIELNARFEGEPDGLPVDEDGYVLVSTADELSEAINYASKIRFAADIESEEGFVLAESVTIDLAGYDLSVTGEGQCSFWVYNFVEIRDSVGGSTLSQPITINYGRLKFSDDIKLAENTNIGIYTGSSLDLSDYTGDNLRIYISNSDIEVIVPEGYCFYSYSGEPFPDFAAAAESGHVFVRPKQ